MARRKLTAPDLTDPRSAPKNRSGAPSEFEIADYISEMERRWTKAHEKWRRINDYYYQRHDVHVPSVLANDVAKFRSPTVPDHIRRATALLTSGYPSITQLPRSDSTQADSRASTVASWCNAFLPQIEKQTGKPIFHDTVHNAVKYGVSFLEVLYYPDAWADYWTEVKRDIDGEDAPARRKRFARKQKELQVLPFIVRSVDPLSVSTMEDEWGICRAIIAVDRPRIEIQKKYGRRVTGDKNGLIVRKGSVQPGELGDGTPQSTNRPFNTAWGTTKWYTYYDRDWVAYFCDGTLVDAWRHDYGMVPLIECRGLSTSSNLPEERYQSVVEPILQIVPLLDSYLSMHHNYARIGAYPSYFITSELDPNNPTYDIGEENKVQPYRPGEIVTLDPGQKPMVIPLPPIGQSLKDMIEYCQRAIQEATPLPPILRGYAPGADTAGYAVNQVRMEAKTVHQPVLANVSTAIEQLLKLVLRIIDRKIGTDVYVVAANPDNSEVNSFLCIGPTDIDGYYSVNCSITGDNIQDVATIQAAANINGTNFLPQEWLWKNLVHITNVDEVRNMMAVQHARQSPLVQQLQDAAIAREAGLENDVNEQAKQMGVPPPGLMPPPGGPPGMPPGMPPGAPPVGLPPGLQPPAPPSIGPGFSQTPGGMGAVPGMPQAPATRNNPGGFPQPSGVTGG